MKNLLSVWKKLLCVGILLPAWAWADIPPMVQEVSSQKVEKDMLSRLYITPKRIVSRYAGSSGNLIKNEHYLALILGKS